MIFYQYRDGKWIRVCIHSEDKSVDKTLPVVGINSYNDILTFEYRSSGDYEWLHKVDVEVHHLKSLITTYAKSSKE